MDGWLRGAFFVAAIAVAFAAISTTHQAVEAAVRPSGTIARLQGVDPAGRFVIGIVAFREESFRDDYVTQTTGSFSRAIIASGDMRSVVTYGGQQTAPDPQWRNVDTGVETSIPMAHPANTYLIPVALSADGQLLLVGVGSVAYAAGGAGSHGSPTVVGRDGSIDAAPLAGAQGVDMSANGRWVLLHTPCVPDGGIGCRIYYRWDRATGAVTALGVPTGDGVLAIGNDGSYVTVTYLNGDAWTGGDSVMLRRDLAGRTTDLLTTAEIQTFTSMSVSQDGSALVLIDASHHVVVVDTATGSRSFPEPGIVVNGEGAQISSDGAVVAFVPAAGPFGGSSDVVIRPVPGRSVAPSVAGGEELSLVVEGVRGVPADVASVALNVTVVNPALAGFATVWPCGVSRPATSNVNFVGGQTVANAVVASVGSGGAVCLYSNVAVDLVVDVQGYFTGTAYTGITPDRFLDTRA